MVALESIHSQMNSLTNESNRMELQKQTTKLDFKQLTYKIFFFLYNPVDINYKLHIASL